MWIVFAAKYWREIIIVFLAFLLAISLAVLNYKTGQLIQLQNIMTAKQDTVRL